MKRYYFALLAFLATCVSKAPKNKVIHADSIYDFSVKDIKGIETNLSKYKGKIVVIVNVASKCGLTPQYESIQKFYEQYKDKGVVVLGFPANNFLFQEPGSDADIEKFCTLKYNVSFDMFSKIDVKGKNIHPLYQYLTMKELNGKMDAEVSWNFQKFLVGKDGKLIQAFSPRTKVSDEEFIIAIEALLKN